MNPLEQEKFLPLGPSKRQLEDAQKKPEPSRLEKVKPGIYSRDGKLETHITVTVTEWCRFGGVE